MFAFKEESLIKLHQKSIYGCCLTSKAEASISVAMNHFLFFNFSALLPI